MERFSDTKRDPLLPEIDAVALAAFEAQAAQSRRDDLAEIRQRWDALPPIVQIYLELI